MRSVWIAIVILLILLSSVQVVNAQINEETTVPTETTEAIEETTSSEDTIVLPTIERTRHRIRGIKIIRGQNKVPLSQTSKVVDTTTLEDIVQLYTIPVVLIAFSCGLLFGLFIMFCLMMSYIYVNKKVDKKCQTQQP